MAYFPAFLKFDDKKILIIGGGNVALEKLEHLLDFTQNITLISIDFNDKMEALMDKHLLKVFNKPYEPSDLKGFDIIIAAIDDLALQEQIYFDTRDLNVLCNCVDYPKYCDFIFPSYVKKGDLTVAISTGGSSPAMAKQLRMFFSRIIPHSIEAFLIEMRGYRKIMPKGKERMDFLDNKAQEYMKTWRQNND
jgi:precorrin-2 dehydrogenase/sirohydrochlorin ferrochelatase